LREKRPEIGTRFNWGTFAPIEEYQEKNYGKYKPILKRVNR